MPIHIGGHKRGGEVVPWMRSFLQPDAVGIVEHLDNGGYPRAFGLARGIGVDRLGQPVELNSVLVRDPEHLGDDVRRQQARDILDQVELVLISNSINDLGCQPLDAGPHPTCSAAQEPG